MDLTVEDFSKILFLVIVVLIFSLWKLWGKYKKTKYRVKELENKYHKIIDVDNAVADSNREKESIIKNIESLRSSYAEKKKILDKIIEQIAIYNEDIELTSLGFYNPHFDFDTSEKFKEEIASVKQEQKILVSSKEAIFCHREWTVDGSVSEGKKMTNRGIRLTARAFNNECEAAISNVRWNNIVRMEERIKKSFEIINDLNESRAINISKKYLELKIKELRLSYEYADKKQKEKEEQQEIKRQMREEVKLELELDKAKKEEDKYNRLLEKALNDAEKASGKKLNALQEKIAELSQDLEIAREKSERAKSMAEQTKRGHVYVISNTGSFGDDVYKIGMTRRLEPLDRVKELGDASVPFTFDVHAMIFSDNAPALENALHRKFDEARLNLVNNRKEFFKVSLSEIKDEVRIISPEAEFIETAEAREYRESLTIRSKKAKNIENQYQELPEAI